MTYRKMGCVAGLWMFLLMGTFSAPALENPKLSIAHAQDALLLSWPDWATNWVLEESSHLQWPIPWRPVSSSNSSLRINPSTATNGFFRLRKLSENVAGLSGHWQFDFASGQPSAVDTPDAPVVLFTNATFESGRVGPQSLHFNGGIAGSGTKAWVSNSNFRVLPGVGRPFSVSMWFNPDALPIGSQGLIGNGNWSVTLQTTNPGTNNIVFSSSSLSVSARTLLIPREWHDLTITYDGTHGNVYLDGNLLAREAGAVATDQQPIYFGGSVGGLNSFLGRIDEVRTYTNALSADQLALTGYWPLDEPAGTVVYDSSIYSHHASVAGILSSTGKLGNALQVTSNAIAIPNDDFMVLPPSGNPFSLSLWLLPRSLPTGRSGLISCGNGTNSNWELTLDVASADQMALALKSSAGSGTLDMRASIALTNSHWAKLDITYDGAVATIYLNGRKIHHDSGLIQSSRAPLRVGYVPGAANFDGLIDELKVYRRERGESEIGPVATVMWETVFRGSTTNFILQGSGPPGKTLTYSILNALTPTNGSVAHVGGSPTITYQAGARKGPDALMFSVSDGEFTSVATLNLSIVEPHWLSPAGGSIQPLDGTSPQRALPAPSAVALDAIWKTNNYYDCFFYAPGTYETSGRRYITRPTAFPGCKHIGSGSDGPTVTIIRLVGMWESRGEEVIFGERFGSPIDGFEVHNMLLDCNGNNNPKLAQGEPVWINLPLTATTLVHSVTIHWNIQEFSNLGAILFHAGAAREFRTCTRVPGPNGYVTNCQTHTSTGQIDHVVIESVTDQLVIQMDRRANGVDWYSIAEIELSGAQVRLPFATTTVGAESRLDANNPAYSILRAVDQNPGTAWASGVETNVQITVPLDPDRPVNSLTLHWNCHKLASGFQLGPASDYLIRARRKDTGQYVNVPFTRAPRTPEGMETNVFSAPVETDQLVLELTAREPDVDAYGLREVSVETFGAPVPLAVPSALNCNSFTGCSVFDALDDAPETAWACDTQGMIGAIDLVGNNFKFTRLKVIGFGTKAARECFVIFTFNPSTTSLLGNIIVEECVFTQPATNNTDGLMVVAVHGKEGSLTNVTVRRCTVRGGRAEFPNYSQAFRANVIEQCLAEDCGNGVYFEPNFILDDYGAVIIRSNRFVDVNNGVLLGFYPGRQFRSITCTDNEMVLTPGHGGWGLVVYDYFDPGTASITNVTLARNVIRYPDWLPRPGNNEGGIFYSDIQHAVFANNVVALGTPSPLRVRQCPYAWIQPPPVRERCPPHSQPEPPPEEGRWAPCLDVLPPGYRRVWLNNRDLAGNLITVRVYNNGVNSPASQQQPPPEIP